MGRIFWDAGHATSPEQLDRVSAAANTPPWNMKARVVVPWDMGKGSGTDSDELKGKLVGKDGKKESSDETALELSMVLICPKFIGFSARYSTTGI